MLNQLKVSIITPSYNRDHFIENTIKSVLNQTYKNIEYIVVDGMSTDNTLNILESYREEAKLIYISEKDKGMYFAINKGLKMATGDIISYINSDDLYFPWTVQKAIDIFQNNPYVDMVYGDSFVIDNVSHNKYLNIYASHGSHWLATGGILCQPTVFLRKKIIDEVGYFNTDYQYLADCEFWLRVNNNPKLNIFKIDEFMAIEYNHSGTLRENYQEDIKEEKSKIKSIFGEKCSFGALHRLRHVLNREIKLWKFIFVNHMKRDIQQGPWTLFLNKYEADFSPLNYVLCKLISNRRKYPRFLITEKKS